MKALLGSAACTLSCTLLIAANGCSTPDAHDHTPDAAGVESSELCGFAPSPCFETVQLTTPSVLVDLAHGDSAAISTTPAIGGASFNPYPKPDRDAGNLNGIDRVSTDSPIYTHAVDPNYPYHLFGTVPASAGWNINWFFNDKNCSDAFKTKTGPIIDASDYDGVTIRLFGNDKYIGPTGQMTFTIDSVSTPEDVTRQQELQTVIDIPSTPTTFAFRWDELTAKCGKSSDFQPGRIIGVAGSFRALAGVAYDLDVVIGVIGFIPKSQ